MQLIRIITVEYHHHHQHHHLHLIHQQWDSLPQALDSNVMCRPASACASVSVPAWQSCLLSMTERCSGSIIVVAMGGGGGGEQEGELSRLRGTTSSNSTVRSISFGLLVVVAVVLANIGY